MRYCGEISRWAIAFLLVVCGTAKEVRADWGLRVGGLHAATELDDSPGYGLAAFIRQPLSRYHIEIGAGYGRLRGADFATDLALGEARILYGLGRGHHWRAHLYGGFGFLRYNIATSPPETTLDAGAIGWAATVPIGIGFQRPLGPHTGLDLHFGYTYTLRDDLDRAIIEQGNDSMWTLSIGFVFGEVGYRVPLRQLPLQTRPTSTAGTPPPTMASTEAEPDRDRDGLSDREETMRYFTNPVMGDSDSDGLGDREEVEIHGTDPNGFDSDRGGIPDGDEIARGANPLDPGDDFVPDRLLTEEFHPVVTPINQPLPIVFFPQGGIALVADARKKLDLVADYLQRHQQSALELHGHSDSVGSRRANLQLSHRRADAVQRYFVERGIDPRRVKVRALGESRPIASNATEKGRLKNRRVELVLIAH